MRLIVHTIAVLFLVAALALSASAAPKKSAPPVASSQDIATLKQYTEELRKNPADSALREKIIKFAHGMKVPPELPEDAEKGLVKGASHFQKASDISGYKRAVAEFEAATNAAPWLAAAYFNLAIAQEKAGLHKDAIQNYRYYLLAAPDAKNAREVKNNIYALEAEMEELQAAKTAAPVAPLQPAPAQTPVAAPAAPTTSAPHATTSIEPAKPLALVSAKPTLDIETPDKMQLNVLKISPADKKSKAALFVGNWAFKDTLRGEDLLIQAFEIKSAGADIAVIPPKRVSDSYATIEQFDIKDRSLKLKMKWKMKSVPDYWKIETYDLTLSEDGKNLTGGHSQRSVGRNVDMDRVLFRQ